MPKYRINTPQELEFASDEEAIKKLDEIAASMDDALHELPDDALSQWHLPLEKKQADDSWEIIARRLVFSERG